MYELLRKTTEDGKSLVIKINLQYNAFKEKIKIFHPYGAQSCPTK